MDKIKYFNTSKQNFRDLVRVGRSYRQPKYEDKLMKEGNKPTFRHDWKVLAHMHDLRLWTIAYTPAKHNNLQRLQELHKLNNEMWYMYSNALWKRILVFAAFWFLINRVFKDRYLNNG